MKEKMAQTCLRDKQLEPAKKKFQANKMLAHEFEKHCEIADEKCKKCRKRNCKL